MAQRVRLLNDVVGIISLEVVNVASNGNITVRLPNGYRLEEEFPYTTLPPPPDNSPSTRPSTMVASDDESDASTVILPRSPPLRLRGPTSPSNRGRKRLPAHAKVENNVWLSKRKKTSRTSKPAETEEEIEILLECLCCNTLVNEGEIRQCPTCVWRMCKNCHRRHYNSPIKRCPHCAR